MNLPQTSPATSLGVVIIGRNLGERLGRCLASIPRAGARAVYVDSGSQDGSVDLARLACLEVVQLERDVPFTAARARNRGLEYLLRVGPGLELVQFVDGDCELVDGWIDAARQTLDTRRDVAVVCGRRREADRSSIFGRLSDLEWDVPCGEVAACGGDAMMRVSAFGAVGGFDASLIAGEEPELCLRLRRRGWKIVRLAREMTRHDGRMRHFGQWWRRSARAGYAFSAGASRYGLAPERYRLRETVSIVLWGAALPVLVLCDALRARRRALLLLAGYPALFARVYFKARRRWRRSDAALYATACVVGKLPEAQGAALFLWDRLTGAGRGAIEYDRGAVPSHPSAAPRG
jgi:GT2 family glycosyltransferase